MGSRVELISRNVTIVNELGLHARSAGKIAAIVKNARSNVWIKREGERADAASVIDILTLACAKGSKISIEIEEPADLNILNEIEELVKQGFRE
ncbi:MAG: HPr family phosphocarrier protein [Desulfobacteraceae bacterium 4572_123]|nr:MAG: HPr family phosphocarrier protein [Desulfobacteraceae bacterium 4572_123]